MAGSRKPPIKKPKGEYHHGDLRRAVLLCAEQMLRESGPDAFTLREAARRIGVDHRALYRHFPDRESVLAAVAVEGYQMIAEATRAALAALPPADTQARLLAIAVCHVEFAWRERGRYRLMAGPRLNESGRFPELEDCIAQNMAVLAAELRAGIERGDLQDLNILEASLAFLATVNGLSLFVITRRVRVRPDQLASFTERLLGHTLRGFKRSTPPPPCVQL